MDWIITIIITFGVLTIAYFVFKSKDGMSFLMKLRFWKSTLEITIKKEKK